MKETKIICWNVNGIKAAVRKGLIDWLNKESPDIICLQETKTHPDILPENIQEPPGYHAYWNFPEKKGYAGVATFTKEEPTTVEKGFGMPEFDTEGRVIITKYPDFTLFNIYFPNGKQGPDRLKFKLDFYDAFFNYAEPLRLKGEKLIICGDVNTAHKEIDIARPKENAKISGFLPIERAWMDKLVANGYIDIFRYLHKEPRQYTWWDVKTRAKERNVGWRIDYFFITDNLLNHVDKAYIMKEIDISDHCPIVLILH